MDLDKIYNPIQRELREVDRILHEAIRRTSNNSILEAADYLLESPGKKLRPALVILSAKAASRRQSPLTALQLANLAAAMELIHMASLIHDDVVDHAMLRHNKPSVNAKWGEDVSIALGDYLYSVGFELISFCRNSDILSCISQAAKSMCEGELTQIFERDNTHLLEKRGQATFLNVTNSCQKSSLSPFLSNIIIVKKKTASLFAASCQAGAILSKCPRPFENALKGYGLNFGVAFQIIDDYMDLVAEQKILGKFPGQDIAMGEVTLPLLNLVESVSEEERPQLQKLLNSKSADALKKIRPWILKNSNALSRTKKITLYYLNSAQKRLKPLPESDYKNSLFRLVHYMRLKAGF